MTTGRINQVTLLGWGRRATRRGSHGRSRGRPRTRGKCHLGRVVFPIRSSGSRAAEQPTEFPTPVNFTSERSREQSSHGEGRPTSRHRRAPGSPTLERAIGTRSPGPQSGENGSSFLRRAHAQAGRGEKGEGRGEAPFARKRPALSPPLLFSSLLLLPH